MISHLRISGGQRPVTTETVAAPPAAETRDARATAVRTGDSLRPAPAPAGEKAPMTLQQAEDVLRRSLDTIAASRTNAAMLYLGVGWRKSGIIDRIRIEKRARGEHTPVTIEDISAHNMQRLYQRLRAPRRSGDGTLLAGTTALDERECAYLREGLKKTYYATHFTDASLVDANGVMKLESRTRLRDADVAFDDEHVDNIELNFMHNDNHTFFSLEPGELPQKYRSRFGKSVYRVPLESPHLQSAFGAHLDLTIPEFPNVGKHVDELPLIDQQLLNQRSQASASSVTSDVARDVFVRKHLVPSILLRQIADARMLSAEGHARVLSARSDADYNRTLNGMLRPQLMNPRATYVPAGGYKYYRASNAPELRDSHLRAL